MLLDPSEGCAFTVPIEDGARCTLRVTEVFGERISDSVAIVGAANETTHVRFVWPDPEPQRVVLGVFLEPDGATIRDAGGRPELQRGDVLVSVAGHDIARFEDIATALEGATTREPVFVPVERDGEVLGFWLVPYAFVTSGEP